MSLIASGLVDQGQLTASLDSQQIEGYIQKLGQVYGDTNLYTGKRVCQERTPGNFSSRTIDGKKYFCTYDVDGKEYRVELPKDTAPDSRPTQYTR